jgi:hypothetical protein
VDKNKTDKMTRSPARRIGFPGCFRFRPASSIVSPQSPTQQNTYILFSMVKLFKIQQNF